MANIKDLKKRIKSTKGTLKITTAMKLVSAAKLAKAQDAIVNSRPYAVELNTTIKTVAALVQNYSHPYLKAGNSQRSLIIVISSEKGLCGSYNSGLVKSVGQFITQNSGEEIKIYGIGKKALATLKKKFVVGKKFQFNKVEPSYEEIKEVAAEVGHLFETGEFAKVYVAYNNFKNALTFIPTVEQILPMAFSQEDRAELKKEFPFDFKYDVPAQQILDTLIPEVLNTSLFKSLLEALASEHGARMGSMDSATKNCKELIRSLTLEMNKLRQAAITTELIEVVSGAEALNG